MSYLLLTKNEGFNYTMPWLAIRAADPRTLQVFIRRHYESTLRFPRLLQHGHLTRSRPFPACVFSGLSLPTLYSSSSLNRRLKSLRPVSLTAQRLPQRGNTDSELTDFTQCGDFARLVDIYRCAVLPALEPSWHHLCGLRHRGRCFWLL